MSEQVYLISVIIILIILIVESLVFYKWYSNRKITFEDFESRLNEIFIKYGISCDFQVIVKSYYKCKTLSVTGTAVRHKGLEVLVINYSTKTKLMQDSYFDVLEHMEKQLSIGSKINNK